MALYVKVPYDLYKPCEIVDFSPSKGSTAFLDFCYSAIDCSCIDVLRSHDSISTMLGFPCLLIIDDDGKLKGDFLTRINPRATVLFCGLTNSPFDIIAGDCLVALHVNGSEDIDPLNYYQATAVLDFLNRLRFAYLVY